MIKNWKLEITENETKLIIQDGAAMNNDILSLARHLVIKYHLNKLPVYHENVINILIILKRRYKI